MSPEIVAVTGLVLIFVIAMTRKINMGAVALVFAFVLGVTYFGQPVAEISGAFPGSLLITLLGVTYLFGMARANGTIDQIVGAAVGLVRGRSALIPWVFFLLAAIITGSGALSAATNAILVPVGLAFAHRYRISPLLVGLSILNGTNAGGFSPIAVYYNIVDGVLKDIGITIDPAPLFFWTFVASLVLNLVAFFLLGGRELIKRGRTTPELNPSGGSPDTMGGPSGFSGSDSTFGSGGTAAAVAAPTAAALRTQSWTTPKIVTVSLMIGLLVAALGFKLDVGFLALTAAVILSALYPRYAKEAAEQIGWNVILLIGGIVTYIGVLEAAGVIDGLANSVAGIGTPLIAALVMFFVAGSVSAFASTNAMFVVLVPLAAPLLLGGDLETLGFVIALCIAATAVDSSPFSTGGALVVANTDVELREKTFRGMLVWAMAMIVAAPLLAWLAFVVI
ncbi:SLC13 family permease [Micrococcus luteus]|nr:SLC13 family permease [Micrococcus luteus]MCV7656731.1 SLC13 family permease [Micrococcus luteus]